MKLLKYLSLSIVFFSCSLPTSTLVMAASMQWSNCQLFSQMMAGPVLAQCSTTPLVLPPKPAPKLADKPQKKKNGCYGNTQNISIYSPIPTDWVITSASGNSRQIMCLSGATDRSALWIFLGPPLPKGWVITESRGWPNTALERYIVFIGNGSYGQTIQVMLGSPIPTGWVITRAPSNDYRELFSTNGARVGTSISVMGGSPIPSGWVIVSSRNGYNTIVKRY